MYRYISIIILFTFNLKFGIQTWSTPVPIYHWANLLLSFFYRWVAASSGDQLPLTRLRSHLESRRWLPPGLRVPIRVRQLLLRSRLRHQLHGQGRPVRSLHLRPQRGEGVPARLGEGPSRRRLLHKTWVVNAFFLGCFLKREKTFIKCEEIWEIITYVLKSYDNNL